MTIQTGAGRSLSDLVNRSDLRSTHRASARTFVSRRTQAQLALTLGVLSMAISLGILAGQLTHFAG